MSPSGETLLRDAHAALERFVGERPQSALALLFAYWLDPREATKGELQSIALEMITRKGAQQDFQTVAAIGFSFGARLLDAESASSALLALKRLTGRSAFIDGLPTAFCTDAIGLLGVAVGAKAVGDSAMVRTVAQWMSTFLQIINSSAEMENWQRLVFYAVQQLLGADLGIPATESVDALDVRAALAEKGLLPALTVEEEQAALEYICRDNLRAISFEGAALRLTALRWLVRTAPIMNPARVSVDALLNLLQRVPAGLRNWTWESAPRTATGEARQWHIDHEYHVQNLLWMLLSPIFPDLDDEQYLKKIGRKSPRADFYIPSLKLIVEAKFLRASDKVQKIIDEIATDLSLYRALGNDCTGVIPFIWDDGARTNEHDYLRHGLMKMQASGLTDTVIVSRPAHWTVQVPISAARRPRRRH